MTATPTNALTIVERVEKSPAVLMLDARASALIDLLPDEAAAVRFRRVVIQAMTKNPDLLACSPESIVSAVFEAAAMGLEPTGAAGGAHLVPRKGRATLVVDYRGVIQMVTRPDPSGRPSDVLSIETRAAKEGDEFDYALGTDAWVKHKPSLAANRSAKPTTHVYAIARLRSGVSIPDVMDRAEVERIQKREPRGNGPWATDWDEMAKKTVIKRLAKVLPVRPEVRSLLTREDELDAEPTPAPEAAPAGASRTERLAARLRPAAPVEEPAGADGQDLDDLFADDAPDRSLLDELRTVAGEHEAEDGPASTDAKAALQDLLKPLGKEAALAGIRAAFGDSPSEGQVRAILAVADSLGHDAFRARWGEVVA